VLAGACPGRKAVSVLMRMDHSPDHRTHINLAVPM
jgi:hypothetical protein